MVNYARMGLYLAKIKYTNAVTTDMKSHMASDTSRHSISDETLGEQQDMQGRFVVTKPKGKTPESLTTAGTETSDLLSFDV